MTDKQKYEYARAAKVANYIAELLRPHCTRLNLAGSIRRLRPEVKDIEIVCEPKREILKDLFGWDEGHITDINFIEALAAITDIIIKGNVEGRYMQIKTTSSICPGIYLDLFMPQPEDYYRILAMRTGSWEHSQQKIAVGWVKKGWVGTHDGLRLRTECIEVSDKWVCNIPNPTLPPVWKSEGEFFTWLGIDYIDPAFREFNKHLNEKQ